MHRVVTNMMLCRSVSCHESTVDGGAIDIFAGIVFKFSEAPETKESTETQESKEAAEVKESQTNAENDKLKKLDRIRKNQLNTNSEESKEAKESQTLAEVWRQILEALCGIEKL